MEKNIDLGPRCLNKRPLFLISLLLSLSGCLGGQVSPLSVELCTAEQGGTKAFLDDLRNVAARHELVLNDNSTETRNELRAVDAGRSVKHGIEKTVSVVLNRGANAKVIVSNLGLPDNQVLISFFYKNDRSGDKKTARQIVRYLKSRYKTENVPVGQGALGMKTCE